METGLNILTFQVRHEFVTVTPDGFRFRKQNFESLGQLMKWFKVNSLFFSAFLFDIFKRRSISGTQSLAPRTPLVQEAGLQVAPLQSLQGQCPWLAQVSTMFELLGLGMYRAFLFSNIFSSTLNLRIKSFLE